MAVRELAHLVAGAWTSDGAKRQDIHNPATGEMVASVPHADAALVDRAVRAAQAAAEEWRHTPVTQRIQPMFRFKALLEEHIDELARLVTEECGKTYAEAEGEVRRGIENVEVACGAPILLQGHNNEEIASGVDEHLWRQPVGVVCAITPFNFPAMIPLWFMPYALAAGNAFILKPSDRVPVTAVRLVELAVEAGFPAGVVSLVHGGQETVEALVDHPGVRAISLVGSTAVARAVYARATALGKRAQCQGGAKNPAVILPDADMELAVRTLGDSAFGCAGQRCLATSVAIPVGKAREPFLEAMSSLARERKVGYGLDEGTEMGPVISPASRDRIGTLIAQGEREGARVIVDGREHAPAGYEGGNWVYPTILDGVANDSPIAGTEIFGPVLSVTAAADVHDAIALVNDRSYGNQASLFTSSGAAARAFRTHARAGNIGINIGVAAPIAFFPFSGWNDSFFGDLHAQARHGFEFYTETKVVIERWPAP
jgi:malonate-semialdehyde dehydrogenase (acetylating) / methylmalonate-semialdehyde dehydrogenase